MPRLSPLCVSPVCRGPMPQCIKVGVNWLKISWLWRKLDWNMKKELRVLQSEKVLHHWHWTNRSITGTTVVEVLTTACLYFLLLSVSVEGFETRQHRHASWHHPHAEIPHTGVWVPGKKCTQQYTNSSSSSGGFECVFMCFRTRIWSSIWTTVEMSFMFTMSKWEKFVLFLV